MKAPLLALAVLVAASAAATRGPGLSATRVRMPDADIRRAFLRFDTEKKHVDIVPFFVLGVSSSGRIAYLQPKPGGESDGLPAEVVVQDLVTDRLLSQKEYEVYNPSAERVQTVFETPDTISAAMDSAGFWSNATLHEVPAVIASFGLRPLAPGEVFAVEPFPVSIAVDGTNEVFTASISKGPVVTVEGPRGSKIVHRGRMPDHACDPFASYTNWNENGLRAIGAIRIPGNDTTIAIVIASADRVFEESHPEVCFTLVGANLRSGFKRPTP